MVSSFPSHREGGGGTLASLPWLDGEYPWGLIVKARALYKELVLKIAMIFVDKVLSNFL